MRLVAVVILSAALIIPPPNARANVFVVRPVLAFVESVVGMLGAKLVEHFFDKFTGRPNLQTILGELQAIKAEMARNKFPLGEKLFDQALEAIGPETTREDFRRLVIVPLKEIADNLHEVQRRLERLEMGEATIQRRLNDHEERLKNLEGYSRSRTYESGVNERSDFPEVSQREIPGRRWNMTVESGYFRPEIRGRQRFRESVEWCENGCCHWHVGRIQE